jgi:hypothetical protein
MTDSHNTLAAQGSTHEDFRQQQDDDRLKMEGEVRTLLDRLGGLIRMEKETLNAQKDCLAALQKALNYFIKLD